MVNVKKFADLGIPHQGREVVHWAVQHGKQQDGYRPAGGARPSDVGSHGQAAIGRAHSAREGQAPTKAACRGAAGGSMKRVRLTEDRVAGMQRL
jgi:hypothetical protein